MLKIKDLLLRNKLAMKANLQESLQMGERLASLFTHDDPDLSVEENSRRSELASKIGYDWNEAIDTAVGQFHAVFNPSKSENTPAMDQIVDLGEEVQQNFIALTKVGLDQKKRRQLLNTALKSLARLINLMSSEGSQLENIFLKPKINDIVKSLEAVKNEARDSASEEWELLFGESEESQEEELITNISGDAASWQEDLRTSIQWVDNFARNKGSSEFIDEVLEDLQEINMELAGARARNRTAEQYLNLLKLPFFVLESLIDKLSGIAPTFKLNLFLARRLLGDLETIKSQMSNYIQALGKAVEGEDIDEELSLIKSYASTVLNEENLEDEIHKILGFKEDLEEDDLF